MKKEREFGIISTEESKRLIQSEEVQMMKVLNFGSLNIDACYKVDRFACAGETVDSLSLTKTAGGKGLNQSLALARAGANVFHAGCVGEDGAFLRELLEKSGVDCSLLFTKDVPTGHAIIQIEPNGQNCILLYGGANRTVTPEHIDKAIDKLDKGDWVLLQNEINNVSQIIEKASAKGLKIALNPSPFAGVKDMPLDKVDRFIMNEYEASELLDGVAEEDLPKKLPEAFPKADFIVTLGSRGALYISKDKCCFEPIVDIEVVDTTGAGDTFTGYVMAELMNGKTVEQAMKTASAASALAVSALGASDSIPTYAQVEEMLKRREG